MSNGIQNQYTPDYVSPPGDILLETLEERGMTQAELAERMGRPRKTINEIIRGKTAITPETALQIERVLGPPAGFWNNYEQLYRQHLAQMKERRLLESQVDWLQGFSIKVMIERGWIQSSNDEVSQLRGLLNFLGVASPEQGETVWKRSLVAFRKARTFQGNVKDLSAWLRRGEIQAQNIYCQPYEAESFRQALNNIRDLTLTPPEVFQPELIRLCASTGVTVAFVPQLPESRVSGATRWLASDKALIQLSLRYKTDDQLWFTFFHEAGHILLHGKRDVFLEDDDMDDDDKEQQADDFAAKILIPPSYLTGFLRRRKRRHLSHEAIKAFAQKLGIAPGIIVGRLQHEGYLPFTHGNRLKRRLAWKRT